MSCILFLDTFFVESWILPRAGCTLCIRIYNTWSRYTVVVNARIASLRPYDVIGNHTETRWYAYAYRWIIIRLSLLTLMTIAITWTSYCFRDTTSRRPFLRGFGSENTFYVDGETIKKYIYDGVSLKPISYGYIDIPLKINTFNHVFIKGQG